MSSPQLCNLDLLRGSVRVLPRLLCDHSHWVISRVIWCLANLMNFFSVTFLNSEMMTSLQLLWLQRKITPNNSSTALWPIHEQYCMLQPPFQQQHKVSHHCFTCLFSSHGYQTQKQPCCVPITSGIPGTRSQNIRQRSGLDGWEGIFRQNTFPSFPKSMDGENKRAQLKQRT